MVSSPPAPAAAPGPTRRPGRLGWAGAAVALVAAGAFFLLRPGDRAPVSRMAPSLPARRAIAVLPFQNLSSEGPHAYFAGGLHDELLTQLSKVADLKVISRTSVMGYAGTIKSLRQVAGELGVGTVVEGSVQVVDDRLRVNVQLIDAATDEHLWAERYDRTLDDAFAIQSDIAQQIVASVGVALSGAAKEGITGRSTANPEAYRLYLQGRDYLNRPGFDRGNKEAAERLFESALAIDPGFALGHAALSEVHAEFVSLRFDPSEARVVRMRQEAETALRIAPDLPQAHIAMGAAHYFGRRDYRKAQESFAIALKGQPGDAALWDWIGKAHRRLGEWDEAFLAFERARQLEPRSAQMYWDPGGTSYQEVRRYADAVRMYDLALQLAPDFHLAAIWRGLAYFHWTGKLDTLRTTLARTPGEPPLGGMVASVAVQQAMVLLMDRDADGLLRFLRTVRKDDFVGQGTLAPPELFAGWAHHLSGDHAAARTAIDSALVLIDSRLRELPDDWRVHAGRGLALAGLGRRVEARREAEWLQRSPVYRADALFGPLPAEERARILAQVGDADAALDEIERLLSRPSWLSVHGLRLDPRWDPIREHPRFQALLAKYAPA